MELTANASQPRHFVAISQALPCRSRGLNALRAGVSSSNSWAILLSVKFGTRLTLGYRPFAVIAGWDWVRRKRVARGRSASGSDRAKAKLRVRAKTAPSRQLIGSSTAGRSCNSTGLPQSRGRVQRYGIRQGLVQQDAPGRSHDCIGSCSLSKERINTLQ